uniref:Preprotein translocase SecG subunit n=1 Tax=Stephanopyxis turris TaxID=515487 RepID=UPI0022F33331|nr:Preprotein translocase SecG subunit [Stephanopyxis turris]WAJ57728.1 Preprotein translocase SecG subunit [Stephanopyxis turris]
MFKIIWLLLDIFLIGLILTRTPNNGGLESFATKSNLLGSPNSAEKLLNNITWAVIFSYFLLAVKFNFSS